jgi:hypothetical protein
MPRKLTKLKISEVSAVDKGAGEGTEIKFWKRDPGATFRKIFGVPPTLSDLIAEGKAKGVIRGFAKQDDELEEAAEEVAEETAEGEGDDDAGSNGGGVGPNTRHAADKLADLLVEASGGGGVTRADALYFLLHTARGQALLRLHRKRLQKETPAMPHTLNSILKDYGVVAVCKSIADGGSAGGMTEHALTEAITEHAKRLYPGLSPAVAFSKVFGADTPEAATFRRAIDAVKSFPRPERGAAIAGAAPGQAYAALVAKGEALRAADPSLTREMGFAKAFSAPENRELAAAERAANRPRA